MKIKMKLAGFFLGLALGATSIYAAGGSCGAGKCGADMKKDMKHDMKDMKKNMKSGSCGAGKCGTN